MTTQDTKGDYILLALIASGYLVFIFYFRTVPQYLLFATLAFALLYMIWGILHHVRTRSLTAKVVLEYFLVAGLAISVVSTLLL